MFDLNTTIGMIGMILILVAFIGDLFKKITEDFVVYNVMNIAGALALAYYAYALGSMPFLVLEFVWVAFAAYKLATLYKSRIK